MMTVEETRRDRIESNIRLCRSVLDEADRMRSWGAKAHNGNQCKYKLRRLLSRHEPVPFAMTEEQFDYLLRSRQALCDVMWQVEHEMIPNK